MSTAGQRFSNAISAGFDRMDWHETIRRELGDETAQALGYLLVAGLRGDSLPERDDLILKIGDRGYKRLRDIGDGIQSALTGNDRVEAPRADRVAGELLGSDPVVVHDHSPCSLGASSVGVAPGDGERIAEVMTVSELRRAIAERLGDDADTSFSMSIAKNRVTLNVHVFAATVPETRSHDHKAGVHTSTSNDRGIAGYMATVYGTDDWEAAAPHLLTLIDDVSGLVVS